MWACGRAVLGKGWVGELGEEWRALEWRIGGRSVERQRVFFNSIYLCNVPGLEYTAWGVGRLCCGSVGAVLCPQAGEGRVGVCVTKHLHLVAGSLS